MENQDIMFNYLTNLTKPLCNLETIINQLNKSKVAPSNNADPVNAWTGGLLNNPNPNNPNPNNLNPNNLNRNNTNRNNTNRNI